jgi:hypothetical protein
MADFRSCSIGSTSGSRATLERRLSMASSPLLHLSGKDFAELLKLVVSAFPSPRQLQEFLLSALDTLFDEITSGSGPLADLVFDVIQWFSREGRLEEFIRKVVEARPGRTDIAEFAARFNIYPEGTAPRPQPSQDAIVDAPAGFMDRESWYARRAAFELTTCRIQNYGSTRASEAIGILVAQNIVLTTQHAVPLALPDLQHVSVVLSRGVDREGRSIGTTSEVLMPGSLQGQSGEELGYVLLEVEDEPGNQKVQTPFGEVKRGWLSLAPERQHQVEDGVYLWSYSHDGRLQSRYVDKAVVKSDARSVEHRHIEPRALGAPLVSSDWAVLAIHLGVGENGLGRGLPVATILGDLGRQGRSRFPVFEP